MARSVVAFVEIRELTIGASKLAIWAGLPPEVRPLGRIASLARFFLHLQTISFLIEIRPASSNTY
jgi:hypothetical protein